MIIKANAKINLGLSIVGKRADGYHNLETIFYPIPLYDLIELQRSENDVFEQSGTAVPGNGNICLDALKLFREQTGIQDKVFIHLHKQIPTGAGLGGGSADAAFLLNGLNEMFQADLSENKLKEMALKLGADCPFFLLNVPAFADGLGENLSPVKLGLTGYHLVLAKSNLHISTAKAFEGIVPAEAEVDLKLCMQEPVSFWKGEVKNDFEITVFRQYPELRNLKEAFYNAGAEYASLTGTGSVVFGLFTEETKFEDSAKVKYYHLSLS